MGVTYCYVHSDNGVCDITLSYISKSCHLYEMFNYDRDRTFATFGMFYFFSLPGVDHISKTSLSLKNHFHLST